MVSLESDIPLNLQTYKHFSRIVLLPSVLTRERFCASLLRKSEKERRDRMQAYCMKCRAKKEMKSAKAITMKNGKPATQGVCPVCGTKMFKIGKG